MRPNRIVAVLFLAAAGCVPGNSPIRIVGAFPLDPTTCKTSMTAPMQGSGTLDVSGSLTYIIDFDVESDAVVAPPLADVNGINLQTTSQNDFVVDSLITSYTMKDNNSGASTTFKGDTRPVYGVIAPGAVVHVTVNLIGENAVKTLLTAVTDTSQVETLIVTATLKGHLQSGGMFSSDPVNFPITVTRSDVGPMTVDCPNTLPNGANATQPTGPCGSGGGQDGFPITCL
jgi:hypothetical protein